MAIGTDQVANQTGVSLLGSAHPGPNLIFFKDLDFSRDHLSFFHKEEPTTVLQNFDLLCIHFFQPMTSALKFQLHSFCFISNNIIKRLLGPLLMKQNKYSLLLYFGLK